MSPDETHGHPSPISGGLGRAAQASTRRRVVLVTGFPESFLGFRVIRWLLREDNDTEIRCVVSPHGWNDAKRLIASLGSDGRRVRLLEGETPAMDLGLSGKEYLALAKEIDVIHHCHSIGHGGVDRRAAEEINVRGTVEVLELAEAAEPERVVYWSSIQALGERRGRILEDELVPPPRFRNVIEETRYRAERLLRDSMARLPVTILRSSILVGDSVTGEIDRLDGPYLLVLVILSAPPDLRIPMPGPGDVALNVVPVDYVVNTGMRIASDPRSIGHTYHIVDPRPLSARRVFELIASTAGRPVPRGHVPAQIAAAILRAPGVERLAQAPRAFLEQLTTDVTYDDRNTKALFEGEVPPCPSFESYVQTMVEYVKKQQAERRARAAESVLGELDDPLG